MKSPLSPAGWNITNASLFKAYTFASFSDAIAFVNQVAILADAHNHHPDIQINYRRVTLSLTTHDAGMLTEKDFALADAINALDISAE